MAAVLAVQADVRAIRTSLEGPPINTRSPILGGFNPDKSNPARDEEMTPPFWHEAKWRGAMIGRPTECQ
jgi:hypothetical protein